MNKQIVLVKYGEIILKGLNRPRFESKLISNIRSAIGKKADIYRSQAAIYITPTEDSEELAEEIANRISRVFGVVSTAVADVIEKDIDKICAHASEMMKYKKGTFKVECKRADKKFPLKSPEISAEVGATILKNNRNLKVDVNNPEILVMVEIRDNAAYIYSDKIAGVGGMPIGTNGKATLLLSGGIDSPVAGYLIAKRGVEIEAVHFYSYPYTSERAKEKVIKLAQILSDYCGSIQLSIVPFTQIQLAINEKCPHEQMTLIMRRMMMSIANRLANSSGSMGLITGESIGQVASQTMESLLVTDNVCNLPVYRPLIGFDKDEIVTIARNIGTFNTSILPYDDCCTVFTPKHPNTKPKLERILKSESKLDVEGLIKKAIEGIEKITIRRGEDL